MDGLLDPLAYLHHLRAALAATAPEQPWVVVEKVLDPSERLSVDWPVAGTTGYDALDALNRLFVNRRGVRILRRFFERLVDDSIPFREEAQRSKRLIMHGALLSGMTMLAHELKRVADASWTTRDISLNSLHEALVEFVAALPVYRTYLGTGHDRDEERRIVTESIDVAERRNPAMDSSAFAFLRSMLLSEPVDDDRLAARRAAIVKRLQQYTSGVQAKGVEDTAFYRDTTLLALNEVGGNPASPSLTTRDFHLFNMHRARSWPDSMTATSTHDSKFSEDARIRIATLSLFAEEWTEAVRRWRTMTAPLRRETRRGSCPDVRDEYRFYQVLIALWNDETAAREGVAAPELVERLVAYMRKAAREAQLNSSWIRPDQDYESGLEEFVRRVMTCGEALEFRESVSSFVSLVSPASTCHSISQLVLKCLMPGVPDFYQGCEDWTFTLTDPDNRRPVDFAAAAERLAHAYDPARGSTRNLKMRITNALLDFCADHRRILREAGYRPLRVRGTQAASVVAFERNGVRSRVIVAVPRLTTRSLRTRGLARRRGVLGRYRDTTAPLQRPLDQSAHARGDRGRAALVQNGRPDRAGTLGGAGAGRAIHFPIRLVAHTDDEPGANLDAACRGGRGRSPAHRRPLTGASACDDDGFARRHARRAAESQHRRRRRRAHREARDTGRPAGIGRPLHRHGTPRASGILVFDTGHPDRCASERVAPCVAPSGRARR